MTMTITTINAGQSRRRIPVEFGDGDVLDYEPDRFHCREGIAVIENLPSREGVEGRMTRENFVVDTFWGSGDDHILSEDELATATVRFNIHDFRKIEPDERFADFSKDDRATLTRQHGNIVSRYIRIGAVPDLATMLENALREVVEREADMEHAASRLESARRQAIDLLKQQRKQHP
ncbi:hypothetical protein [Agromyces humi]|uniref:hypothetical protein n=1 Tax=Agromyces humi TaxID=1766800 RepID=UPI0013597537|nr:hypothetical protein [Agromyces humi]